MNYIRTEIPTDVFSIDLDFYHIDEGVIYKCEAYTNNYKEPWINKTEDAVDEVPQGTRIYYTTI